MVDIGLGRQMHTLALTLQVVVALGLLNVWLVRANSGTPYRGGGSRSMAEEFAAYGLPDWARIVVGTLKVGAAAALIAGIWMSALVVPAAVLVSVLMLGALAMHFKVGDPLRKSVPALIVLLLCVAIWVGTMA